MPARLIATLAVAVAVVGALAVTVWRSELSVQRARTVLSHSGGLREGSAVTYRGVVVGIVSRMAFDTNGLAVDLDFRQEVPLRTGDSATVGSMGLLCDRTIDILPGTSGAPLLPPNGLIAARSPQPGVRPEDLAKLLRAPPETVYRDTSAPASRP